MAVSDWNLSSSLNTSVGGVPIPPGMQRSDVDNAIRALMAEAKAGFLEGVSVIQYGATGDGTTDDTAAIQSAINAAAITGGAVLFPKGRYKITSPLVVSSTKPVTLTADMGGQVYNPSANPPAILIGAAMDYAIVYEAPNPLSRGEAGGGRVKGLSFIDPTGLSGAPGTNTVIAALFLKDFALSAVEDCSFHWIKGSAIKAENAVMTTVRGCRIRYCGDAANLTRAAVLLAGASQAWGVQSFILDDCRVEVCYSTYYLDFQVAGSPFNQMSDITVRSCKFEAAPTEYPTSSQTFVRAGCERFLIDGCGFNRTNAVAVEITANGGSGVVTGCRFVTGVSAALSLKVSGVDNVISGNQFKDTRTGVSVEMTGVRNQFCGNVMYASGGVYATGNGNQINGNQFADPSAVGIGYLVTVAAYCQANENRFDGSGGAPAIGGIITYLDDQIIGNQFRNWTSANACVRRESAGSIICGQQFSNVTLAYSQSIGASAGTGLRVDGAQVVTGQQAAVADAAGGATVDTEARAAINALLSRLRTHGLIAP